MSTATAESLASHSDARVAGVAAARRRHPTARSGGRARTLRIRMAAMLRARGAQHPDVAVMVLEARGRLGLDQDTFARRLGVAPAVLAVVEAGDLAADELLPALAALSR